MLPHGTAFAARATSIVMLACDINIFFNEFNSNKSILNLEKFKKSSRKILKN